jgi:hypothetical protein
VSVLVCNPAVSKRLKGYKTRGSVYGYLWSYRWLFKEAMVL